MWPPGGRLTELERMRLALEGLDKRLSTQRPWLLLVEWRAEARARAKMRATPKTSSARASPSYRGN